MIPKPYTIPYYPNPHHPSHQPTSPASDVGLANFKAAQDAGAGHLSVDGKRAYRTRYGVTFEAGWQAGTGSFSAWWPLAEGEGVPEGAVKVDLSVSCR